MIEITKTTNGFLAVFTGNDLYLDEGTVSMPMNSLSMTIDESGIATFRKAVNGDVFFSGKIGEISFDGTTPDKAGMAAAFADTCLQPEGASDELEQRVEALEDTVGDSTSGLVKDVNDLETTVGDSSAGLVHDVTGLSTSVGALQTTVGDSTSGLVKDVDDLETTVGNSSAGLVHDVNGLNSAVADIGLDVEDVKEDVDVLQTTVGDSTSGLIKEVSDLFTEVEENGKVTSEALTALRKIILDNERTTSEALTELRKMIGDTNDLVDGIDDRLTQAEADITTLDTVMSAAVNQLS